MRRIFRDTWCGRGGLALDELRYSPVPADAMAGPIVERPEHLWPRLVSVVEVVALLLRDGAGVEITTGVAALHSLLSERSGGYHARIPARIPEVEDQHACLRDGTCMVGAEAALRAMERIGLVERSARSMVLLRPPDPTPEDLLATRDHMDVVSGDPDHQLVERRLTRLAWRVERGDGIYVRRFRQLSRLGRLRVTVHPATPGFADPHGLFEVGPASLPSPDHWDGATVNEPHAVRGGVTAHDARYGGHGAEDPWRLPLTPYEVGALLLGGGVGANATRRSWRATGLWMLLVGEAPADGRPFDTTVARLAVTIAPYFGLSATGDHRSTVTTLLGDLERTGLIATCRPARKTLRVALQWVAGPRDEQLRHFLRQLAQGRWGSDDGTVANDRLVDLAGERQRAVRAGWVELLEQRRVTVEVLPGPDG